MVAVELRCLHSWPTGVDPGLFVKNAMPKLDSAASEHIVWSEKFLDNYVSLGEELHGANMSRRLVLLARVLWLLPDGSRSKLVLHDVLHIPAL